jgi:hypothetical protein
MIHLPTTCTQPHFLYPFNPSMALQIHHSHFKKANTYLDLRCVWHNQSVIAILS